MPQTAHNLLLFTLYFFVIYCTCSSFFILYFKKAVINFLLIAGFIFPAVNFYVRIRHLTENDFTQVTITNYIQQHDAQRKIYLFQDYEEISTVLFFLQKSLPIIDTVSRDLYYGYHTSWDERWSINHNQFLGEAHQHPVYVVLLKKRLKDFNKLVQPMDFCVVAQSGKAAVLTNSDIGRKCLRTMPLDSERYF